MYSVLFPYLLGVLLAWTTWYPARHLYPRHQQWYFTLLITVVILGFVGFPLEDADNVGLAYEAGAAVLLLVLVALGRSWSRWLIPLAWFGHGCWDLAYLVGLVPVDKPLWVVQLCVPYDWLIAAYLVTRVRVWNDAGETAAREA